MHDTATTNDAEARRDAAQASLSTIARLMAIDNLPVPITIHLSALRHGFGLADVHVYTADDWRVWARALGVRDVETREAKCGVYASVFGVGWHNRVGLRVTAMVLPHEADRLAADVEVPA